jgi:hypothetical protein
VRPQREFHARRSWRRAWRALRLGDANRAIGGQAATEPAAVDWILEQVPSWRRSSTRTWITWRSCSPYVVFEGDFTGWFIRAVKTGNDHMARRFCAGRLGEPGSGLVADLG